MFPSKVVNLYESVLFKSYKISEELSKNDYAVLELYEKTKKNFEDIDEFIVALDLLYTLGEIKLDNEWEILKYVENDSL